MADVGVTASIPVIAFAPIVQNASSAASPRRLQLASNAVSMQARSALVVLVVSGVLRTRMLYTGNVHWCR